MERGMVRLTPTQAARMLETDRNRIIYALQYLTPRVSRAGKYVLFRQSKDTKQLESLREILGAIALRGPGRPRKASPKTELAAVGEKVL